MESFEVTNAQYEAHNGERDWQRIVRLAILMINLCQQPNEDQMCADRQLILLLQVS